jgi:membrane protein implicated in regulation of membrane protease activity
MENIFLGCFLFGAIFTLVSTLLGNLGPDAEIGSLGKLGKVGKMGKLHAELPDTGPLDFAHVGHVEGGFGDFLGGYLTLSSIVAFVTWFGAGGYMLLKLVSWPLLVVVPIAVIAGLVGASVIAAVLAKIKEGDRPMKAQDYELPGTVARVSVSIPENGVGEIVFSLAGTRRVEAARMADGGPVPDGLEVVITGYERGIATVAPLQLYLTEEAQTSERRQKNQSHQSE